MPGETRGPGRWLWPLVSPFCHWDSPSQRRPKGGHLAVYYARRAVFPAFPSASRRRSVTIADVLSTAALRAHLLAARLAGPVATSREESLRSYRLFAARDPRALLGLDPEWTWRQRDLIELMADKCGVSADPRHVSGQDVIDPERTLTALD